MSDDKTTLASLTRIADLERKPFERLSLDRGLWATGDYVVGEVTKTMPGRMIELASGRKIEVCLGDLIVGAFGVRAATLEAVGSWRDIAEDGRMRAMTAAGLFGTVTSQSSFEREPIHLVYRGHVTRSGKKVTMGDFVRPAEGRTLGCPVVLLIGTSMSSGKTTAAKIIIRRLKKMGLRVTGAKLTGAGRYRDILAMSDAGADAILDFVDVGLPSTVCDEGVYQPAFDRLISFIAETGPDILVAEAGASPIEPYNGQVAVSGLKDARRFTVLCASDPYAVIGVTKGFDFHPDLVTGICTSTSAGVAVIRKLVETAALDLTNPTSHPELDRLLIENLGI